MRVRNISTLLIAFSVVACTATQPAAAAVESAPGFIYGFWHGLIAPVTFFVSIFADNVRVYAFPNTGVWYDLGFMLGISGFSGGLFAGSRKKS